MHFFLKIIRYIVLYPQKAIHGHDFHSYLASCGTTYCVTGDNLIEKSENSFVSSSLDCKTCILYYWLIYMVYKSIYTVYKFYDV